MKLLIMSDTHGNQTMIHAMIDHALKVDITLHLGDNYHDAQAILDAGACVIRIPGTWGAQYQDPLIDNRRFETWLGWRFFLTHTPEIDAHDLPQDLDPFDVLSKKLCDVFCHGHTHEPMLRYYNDVLILNPGHLKGSMDRGFAASYAVATLTQTECSVDIIDFQSQQIIEYERLIR